MSFLETVREATSRWLALLDLGEWRVSVEVKNLGKGYYAVTYPSYDYLEAIIQYNDPTVCGSYDVERVVAHEVCHLPMAEFSTKAGTPERRAEERVVERFSRTMLAILRGVASQDLVKLVPKLRAAIGASFRARRAIAARTGRYRMDPKLVELIMKAGELAGREDVPEDVREVLKALVAASTSGEAPPVDEPGGDDPPAAEAAPDMPPAAEAAPDADAPPVARTAGAHAPTPPRVPQGRPGSAPAPTARAAVLAAADRDAARAAELARKRVQLEEDATREALFRSSPDVFPELLPKAREAYATASPEEVERHIAAVRATRAAPGANGGRARGALDTMREPPPGAPQVKNDGGVVIRAGGKVVS